MTIKKDNREKECNEDWIEHLVRYRNTMRYVAVMVTITLMILILDLAGRVF